MPARSIVAYEEWLELGDGERPAPITSTGSSATTGTTASATASSATGSRTVALELEELTGRPVPRPAAREGELPARS